MPNRVHGLPLIILLALSAAALLAVAEESYPPDVQKLRKLIHESTDTVDVFEKVPQAAIDAGPEALPYLREVLARGPKHQAELAMVALAYLGGDSAVDLLRQRFKATQDIQIKSLLAIAMASTRQSAENRAFLEDCLKGEQFGTQWMPSASAAFSLGVLRAPESRDALEKAAKKAPGSIVSEAAEDALLWIAQGQWKLDASSMAKIEPPVGAVLRNGVPRTDEAERFFDRDRPLVWIREGATWRVKEADRQSGVPSLSFHVHRSPDEKRALVSVAVTFGPQNGVGYNYVLRKDGVEWIVQGVVFAWIS